MIGTSKSVWGFVPRTIPGSQLWLDGADPSGTGTPPASGATVSTWNDKSGNGKNATATGTSTYISGGGVNFTGSSYFLNQTFAMNLSQRSIFVVFQETTTSYSAGVIVFIPTPNTGDDSGSTSGMTCEIGFPDNLWFYGNNDGYRSMIGGSHPLPKAIYHDSMNGTTGSGYLNGTNATNVTAGYTATTCSGYALGGRWQGGSMSASYRQNGVIYEILVYNSALTTSQRQQVEGYLAHKWGLTGYYAPTTPLTIPGCQLWLDGADPVGTGTPPANGTILSTWVDKSGNGRNTTATGTGPTYTTNTFNGYSAPVFNGTIMRTPSYLISTDSKLSIFVLCKKTGSRQTGENSGILGITAGYQYFYLYIRTSVTNYLEATYQLNVLEFTNYSISDGSTLLMTFLANGLSTSGYLNGTSVFNTSVTNNGYSMNNLTSQWIIGEGQFVGPICEIIIFNSTFTNAQRQTIETYLAKKWGLTTLYPSIPSTHPFYSIRPHLRAFQPIDVPGCLLWLDGADQGSMTLSGSSVTQWRDKSGRGFNVATSSGATAPLYNSSTKELQFVSGNSNSFTIPQAFGDALVGTTFSFFFIGRRTVNTTYVYFLSGATSGGNQNLFIGFLSNKMEIGEYGPYASADIPTFNSPDPMRLYYYDIQSSTTANLIMNGNPLSTTVSGNLFLTSFAQPELGRRYGGAVYHDFNLSEMVVFSPALNTSQRQQVEGYLAHKWGLTSRFSTPLTIPGCAMWLDGADPAGTGTPPVSGTTISTWVDKSGNSNNGTSGTAAFQTDALGGYINFTGSQSYVITNPNIVVNQYFTIFIVEQIGNVSPSQDYVLMKGSTNDNNRNLHIVYRGGSPVIAFAFYFNDLNVNISSYGYGTGNTQPTRLWTFSFIANSRNIYLNGTSIASDNNNTFLASWTGARIGSHPSPSDYYIGKIRELMIYSGTVNTTQRQTIEGYLSQKWGLGVSSTNPSTHPFKSFPPASLPFSPRNISGLQLWLDAADSSTITGTTSVTAWRDKSTNGYVANSFVNSVPNPSLVPNIRNGNGVIQYTAGNGSSIANFVLAQTMSIFKVYYPINQSIGSPFIEQGPNVNNESGFFFHSQNDNNFYIRAGSIGLANFGTTTVSNTWQMIEGINPDPANGNTVAFYVNGTTRASGGTQSDTTTITKTLYINGRGGANNLSYNTYLAELIIYNIGLTSSQRQQVEGYLAHKWGMSASLPSTHPYSKFPPP